MFLKQHTIKKEVSLSGVGLHTGIDVEMTFSPAPVHHGIKFQRIDLEGQPIVEANVDYVVDVSRGTSIEQHGARINTIEHTLAAVAGLQIDNILIKINGPEPPIMDGSSIEFINLLNEADFEEQDAPRDFFEVTESIFYNENDRGVQLAALPLDDYRVTVMIEYNSPTLGSQHASLNDITQFESEIASSRTFCFLHELEMLHKNNLIKGGNIDNAIVVVDREIEEKELEKLAKLFNKSKVEVKKGGILNNINLRHKNEPVRHKLLDVIGDLALIGKPIKAQILAERPGHAANVAFAKKIKKSMQKALRNAPVYNPALPPIYDINDITSILPHRYPFLLIDKIIQIDKKTVTGIKNVTINDNFFQGHFPDNPLMPGVLQIEAMAQIGGILVLNTVDNPEDYWTYFLGVENFRFRKMVVPGDTLVMKCELTTPIKRGISKMYGKAYVENTLVCEGLMMASIVKKDST